MADGTEGGGPLTEMFEVRLPASMVLPKAVADFWRAEEMCDAQLLVQGQIFNAHRLVLAAASAHFATAFKAPDDIPLEVEGSPEAVSVLLEYLYVGKVSVSEAMLEQMRVLAEQLALSSLLSDVRAIIATKTGGEKPELDEAAAILLGVNTRDVPGDAGEQSARDEVVTGAMVVGRGGGSGKQARATGGGSSGAKKVPTAQEVLDNDDNGGCWGGQLKGEIRILNQPCAATFIRGRGHLKNKVCDMCNGKKADLVLPASRVCGLPMPLHDAFINSSDSGVWTQADEALGGGKFRVVNNTATCVPPRLIIFQGEPPKLQWDPLPPHWVHNGEVSFFLSSGTLVPLDTRKAREPRKALIGGGGPGDLGLDPSALGMSPFPMAMAPPGMMLMPGQGQRSLMAIPSQPPGLSPFPMASGPFPSADGFGGSGTIATAVVSSANGAVSSSMLASKAMGNPPPVPGLSPATTSNGNGSGPVPTVSATMMRAATGSALLPAAPPPMPALLSGDGTPSQPAAFSEIKQVELLPEP